MANDFLTFAQGEGAIGYGANVLSPAIWADDKERVRGFSAGPSRVLKANTVWRQSAFVSSNIAQFIGNQINEDVRDNGNQTQFVDQFGRAIIHVVISSSEYLTLLNTIQSLTDRITALEAAASAQRW